MTPEYSEVSWGEESCTVRNNTSPVFPLLTYVFHYPILLTTHPNLNPVALTIGVGPNGREVMNYCGSPAQPSDVLDDLIDPVLCTMDQNRQASTSTTNTIATPLPPAPKSREELRAELWKTVFDDVDDCEEATATANAAVDKCYPNTFPV